MSVLLDRAGKKIKGSEVTEEAFDSAMRSLGALELLLLEAAKPMGCNIDSRLGILADEALELLRTRYTAEEQSRITGPGDSCDESIRNLLSSHVRRIPSILLKGVKEEGFSYKQWRITQLGAVVAIKAVSRIREMLDSEDERAIWGLGINMETQVIPVSGEARTRRGYIPFAMGMEGKVMPIAGGQPCVVRSWTPDIQRFKGTHPMSKSEASGSCFVEFPDGVDFCSAAGAWGERIDHPIFLWVLGSDLTTAGKCQSMRIVRHFQPMTGLKRVTRQMPDGTEEVVVDTLTGAEDKPTDNAR
jgi:hypothetical protein